MKMEILKNNCFQNEVEAMKDFDSNMGNCESKRNQVILQGTVVFRQSDSGSKNEGLKPFLYCNDNSIVPLFKKGDNPFENDSLKKIEGLNVILFGCFHNKVFEVSDIKEIVDNSEMF